MTPLSLGLVLALTGCRTSPPERHGSQSMAAVVVYGALETDIRQAAKEVFQEDQFRLGHTNATQMFFEKRGSRLNDIVYGSFLNNEAWIRAKLKFRSLDEDRHLLECDAYMVRNFGEKFFEEESELSRWKRGHYQELLETIQRRVLDSSRPPPP